MARGIGTLTVSVQANTAKAIKNLRDFSHEARSTGKSARQMAADFTGNTIGDYMQRFVPKPKDLQQSTVALKDLDLSVVDLTRETNRYNSIGGNQIGVLKGLEKASKALKAVGKIAIPAIVAVESFNFGRKLQLHLEYINSWSDAWRELKSTVGMAQSGYDMEMDKLAKRSERQAANIAKMDEQLASIKQREEDLKRDKAGALAEANRERDVAMLGEDEVRWREDVAKFGMSVATRLAEARDVAKTIREQQEAAAKKEEERQKKEKAHYDNLRADAKAVQQLRDRVADSGKTSLQAERDQLLRTIEDVQQQAQVRQAFRQLEDIEARKDQVDRLKSQRDSLAKRTGNAPLLDARTAEGWAALRSSVRSPEIAALNEQIAILKSMDAKLGESEPEEVFSL